ncbi:Aste57867_13098 [Aphanomyces stellatus]|uniref:P-type Ca(2+) transporter n=1 Tax=Aphanomyces stellatus TaxID=120398 RepID=A0A485KYX1_9STRA|nr:hypothetical protein As57867_013050 [Aphanomyces stellatus]VFT89942.1 Aste57867_13098 [Aphanomyces stellatus]
MPLGPTQVSVWVAAFETPCHMTRVTPLHGDPEVEDATFLLPSGVPPGPGRVELEAKGPYGISKEGLMEINRDLMTEENFAKLNEYGGADGLASKLGVDLVHGIAKSEVESQFAARRARFGTNTFVDAPSESFLSLFVECFKDTTLIILNLAAVASIATGLIEDPKHGWVEGMSILLAVVLVALVSTTSNYTKEKQFRALSAKNDEFNVKVIRGGTHDQVPVGDINVGELVTLETGDKIPADAVLVRGQDVKCNESSLTGEPDEVKKDAKKDPFLLSGCLVASGQCDVLITAVGVDSRWGRIKAKLVRENRPTPLMEKLDDMVKIIGYGGMGCAVATMIAMIVIYALTPVDQRDRGWVKIILDTFIMGVTIVVVAIPEGLPLAVTISLSYSTKKMLKDNNLIRVLAACETMGNCTSICSDKTGTLTQNRMTVVQLWTQARQYDEAAMKAMVKLDKRFVDLLAVGIAVNSTAHLLTKPVEAVVVEGGSRKEATTTTTIVQGSKTEGALLVWLKLQGIAYKELRTANYKPGKGDRMFGFSSERKTMTTIVRRLDGTYRLFSKGAAEIVLRRCTHVLTSNGTTAPIHATSSDDIHENIVKMAKNALRTVCVAYRDFGAHELPSDLTTLTDPPEKAMVLCAIFGIMDPLRPDVTSSIAMCIRAGITVRMVTGDNIHTARAIAKQCGILTDKGVALEGPDFRKMDKGDLKALLPKLQVLARSSPDDKHMLVTLLRDRAEVVGVTGDGTNDAPALRAADVGLAMGIAGTDLAKEAADIIIMDDCFSSIKQSVLWGRCVYDNIRKFLQFQLTVNIVALSLTFLSALSGFAPPLNAVMMLWVNLIMDTMGALALGTETPKPELLLRHPYKKDASLVSRIMIKNILVQSAFQLATLLLLLFSGPSILNVRKGNACVSATYSWKADLTVPARTPCAMLFDQSACPSLNCSTYVPLVPMLNQSLTTPPNVPFDCVNSVCDVSDYRHFTFIFNVFVFSQIFNEINARSVSNDWRVFSGLATNPMFVFILVSTGVLQIFLVEFGGDFTQTASMTAAHWIFSVLIASISLPLGFLMRFIPIEEHPNAFANPNELQIT